MKYSNNNSNNLNQDLKWLSGLVHNRKLWAHQKIKRGVTEILLPGSDFNSESLLFAPPELEKEDSVYAQFILNNDLQPMERLLLILGLSSHIHPGIIDHLFNKNILEVPHVPETGLVKGGSFAGSLPTGVTFLFLAGGYNINDRFNAQKIFFEENALLRNNIIQLEPHFKGDPTLSGRIVVTEKWVEYFTLEKNDLSGKGIKYQNL